LFLFFVFNSHQVTQTDDGKLENKPMDFLNMPKQSTGGTQGKTKMVIDRERADIVFKYPKAKKGS